MMGLERLNAAAQETLEEQYRWARAHVEATAINERNTLQTVTELASDAGRVGSYVRTMQETIDRVAQAHLAALETHMQAVATKLGVQPVRLRMSDLERRASRMVPRQTALVKRDGYGGWEDHLEQVPAVVRQQFPYDDDAIASTNEVNLLIDGKNSVLDIKKALDAQNKTTSDLQAIINYVEVLRAAGLVEI